MQKIINQILEGNFDYENGSLDFSCAKIEINLKKGEVYEGSFIIYAPQGRFNSGKILSSDLRMECVTADFIGCEEEVFFRFHGEKLESGDVVKGNFYIISNLGEYYLPFVATVEHQVLESSVGPIKNLFHFTNLAKTNWDEALRLYYSPDFNLVFEGTDAQYKEVYRALSVYDRSEQNMEEFLIRINKKQKVEFLVQEEITVLENRNTADFYSVVEKEIPILRNGWGYTRLNIAWEGDFLFSEKEVLTDDDFLGNRCTIPVYIDLNACREGKSFGRVILYNSYVSISVPVTVRIEYSRNDRRYDINKKRSTVQIMELYQAFRMKKVNSSTWRKESEKIVEKMVTLDENDVVARLYQAQLLITEGSNNEAGWILDHVSELLEKGYGDDTILAYYLYLTTLLHREEKYVNRVTTDVERIYRSDNANWRVAWLLLYLSDDYRKSVTGRWIFLEKQFYAGCTSPVLYLEAVSLVNGNPNLLRKLEQYEIQIIRYGVKMEILKEDVIRQIIYLADKQKEYSVLLFHCLAKLYEKNRDNQLLQQICSLLIKGNKAGLRYFEWYQAGIENKLRITNLYEYYMMSLNLNEYHEIPKEVLLYFSYQCNLDYERTAYLYAYIVRNEEKYDEIMEMYQNRMERFVMEQISKMHISRHLGFLYNKFIQPGMITTNNAGPLSRLLFANQLRVENSKLQKVYIYHPGKLKPSVYQITGDITWVSLYGNEYTLVFEDVYQNRFVKNVEYTLEKLILPGKLIRYLLPFDADNEEYDLYLYFHDKESFLSSEFGVDRALRLVHSKEVEQSVRNEILLLLLQHYHDTDNRKAAVELLQTIDPKQLTVTDRGEVMRFMVLEDQYDLAKQWLSEYGPYFLEPKLLLRLLGSLLESNEMTENQLLVSSAYYVFQKGRYNSKILVYLSRHYEGLVKNLRDIWKASRSFDLDGYDLCERILAQMLYSGAYVGEKMDIFEYYLSQGPKAEIEDAFLTQCAYEYFVKEQITDKLVFDEILRTYWNGEPLQQICKLAFVKYYAENQTEMTEQVEELAMSFLTEFVKKGIYLDFFREYRKNEYVRIEMEDKVTIEYRAKPQTRVCIHYVVLHEEGETGEYHSEYMKEIYYGVYTKEFVLFFGENLQYYITEDRNGEEQLTESGTLQKSEIQGDEHENRYRLVNDIVISKSLQDYDTMENLIDEYYQREFFNSKLFRLR